MPLASPIFPSLLIVSSPFNLSTIIKTHISNPFLSSPIPPLHPHRTSFISEPNRTKPNMSWQTYVDEYLMCDIDGTGQHLSAAAIIGHDGSIWAQSSNFPKCQPKEITDIMKDFDKPGHLAPTGLHLGGTKFMVIQGEPGAVIRGKKGSGGVTIKKTAQAMVFGIYEEPVTPGQCNLVVERLGDYLTDQGL